MAKLTLIRGIPGTGKSTYARKHYRCLHLEADMFWERDETYQFDKERLTEAHKWLQSTVEAVMLLGLDLVVTGTFHKFEYLEPYLQMAEQFGYTTETITLYTQYGNTHGVPPEQLEKFASEWEVLPGENPPPVQLEIPQHRRRSLR